MAYIGQAKKAWNSLSDEAKDAISSWERSQWVGGALENSIRNNDAIAKEIESVFAPIRKTLGSTIRLYRGETVGSKFNAANKFLSSWTDDRKVAEGFAGLRTANGEKDLIHTPITDAEIAKAYKDYQKFGFVKFRSKIYKKNDKHPELKNPDYYDIYSLNRSYVTDGDDLVHSLKQDQEWITHINKTKTDQAVILDKIVKTSQIIWITNNLGSKEFIVRNLN